MTIRLKPYTSTLGARGSATFTRRATKVRLLLSRLMIASCLTACASSTPFGRCHTGTPATSQSGFERTPAYHAVETAYQTTLAARTARVVLDVSPNAQSSAGPSGSGNVTGTGVVDFTTKAFDLNLALATKGAFRVLDTGGLLYEMEPPSEQVKGKPWTAMDQATADEATEFFFPRLAQLLQPLECVVTPLSDL